MKRIIALLLATVCVACCFGACAGLTEGEKKSIQAGVAGTKENNATEVSDGEWSKDKTRCIITDAGIEFDMTEFKEKWSSVDVKPEDNKGNAVVLMKAGKKSDQEIGEDQVYNNVMVVANKVENVTPENFLTELKKVDAYKDIELKDADGMFADLDAKFVVLDGKTRANKEGTEKEYKQKIIAYQLKGKEDIVFTVIITAANMSTIGDIEGKFEKSGTEAEETQSVETQSNDPQSEESQEKTPREEGERLEADYNPMMKR